MIWKILFLANVLSYLVLLSFWNDHKGAHLGTYFPSVFLKLAKHVIWNGKEEVWKYPDLNWYVFEPF